MITVKISIVKTYSIFRLSRMPLVTKGIRDNLKIEYVFTIEILTVIIIARYIIILYRNLRNIY